jgi:hypothetical protein
MTPTARPLTIRPLTLETWEPYAALIARHDGVWGGCWCMGFHAEGVGKGHTAAGNRAAKLARVEAEAALRGALALIRAAGGGTVEAMPEDATGRKTPGAFLWGGELGMFERAGFERVRPLGKSSWLVRAVP